ncbi:hypothetical protein ACFL35_08005 [Candidatus Riflebacteria bacterium]
MKREIPMLITFVVCLMLLIQYFFNFPALDRIATSINDYTSIVAAFAMILGLASLAQLHSNRIYRRQETWRYSIVLVVAFFITVYMGLKYGIDKTWKEEVSLSRYNELIKEKGEKSENHSLYTENRYFIKVDNVPYKTTKAFFDIPAIRQLQKEARRVFIYEQNNYFYSLIFERMYIPLQATMFSLLAFFMASAAFRAFRAKSFEASLLLISAFLVMLGRVPIGEVLGQVIGVLIGWLPFLSGIEFSKMFGDISQFIMDVPNSAGQRAIMIGAALGIVSASLRIWLGLETEHLGRE